jgi:drug/metabolite transporter (DMT)-like permease
MNKKLLAIFFAILAAGLYAINIPLSKLLLKNIEPTMMASYLYLGAGIGIGIVFLITKNKDKHTYEKITKKDFPNILGMIMLDIAAPILLMFGLIDSASTNASLLNNFEIVCTSLIALLVFKEAVSKRMWLAISLITISSFVLSFEDVFAFTFSWGAILVLLATLCWGLENNCTKNLSSKNTYRIVILKGVFSGIGSLIVALCMGEKFAIFGFFALALLLGFVAYGLSIFFYIKAQAIIGASKTSAYYAIAPFIGTFLSFVIFQETPTRTYLLGFSIMILGTIIVVVDTLAKKHTHTHKHIITHTHDGSTHSHTIEHEHSHNHYLSDKKHQHIHKKTKLC